MVQTGKGLAATFQAQTERGDRSKELLPVFNNSTYSTNIDKLVNSKDLRRSFDLLSHP
jgi:hypothetical protein